MNEKDCNQSIADSFYGAVTVGERGQVVIPAEARSAMNLEPGEKLLVFRPPHMRGIMLTRVDELQEMVTGMQQWAELMAGFAAKAARTEKGRSKRK